MARIHKRNVSIGFGKESTRGTAVAATIWYPKLDMSFVDHKDKIRNETHIGVMDRYTGSHVTKEWGEGSLEGPIYKNLIGHLLTNLFGQTPTTTTVETTARKHVFAMATGNTHITHTIAVDDANEDLRFPMGMINTFTIDYVRDDYVKFSAEFLSKKSTAVANSPS